MSIEHRVAKAACHEPHTSHSSRQCITTARRVRDVRFAAEWTAEAQPNSGANLKTNRQPERESRSSKNIVGQRKQTVVIIVPKYLPRHYSRYVHLRPTTRCKNTF